MAKDVINVEGEDVVVREDTAKKYRGLHWGITTVVICLAILAILFIAFFWKAATGGKIESPTQIENSNSR